jgi:hypothetical protein
VDQRLRIITWESRKFPKQLPVFYSYMIWWVKTGSTPPQKTGIKITCCPIMTVLNYILAILLTVFWAVGFFSHLADDYIHLFLITAFVLMLLNIFRHDRHKSGPSKHHTCIY